MNRIMTGLAVFAIISAIGLGAMLTLHFASQPSSPEELRRLGAEASAAEARAAQAWVQADADRRAFASFVAGKQIRAFASSAAEAVLVISAALCVAIIATGSVLAISRWLNTQALVIKPNAQGMLPVLVKQGKDNKGQMWLLTHDPNRALGSTTVYYINEATKPKADHLLPADTSTVAQITTQAQAISLVAASAQSNASTRVQTERLVQSMTRPQTSLGALPPVRQSPLEPSHVERLLLEAGEVE